MSSRQLQRAFAIGAAVVIAATVPSRATAQRSESGSDTRPGDSSASAQPLVGQDAYAAIAEIVRILEKDPQTDWTHVNLEALRQHLIDMNEVTLRSVVRQVNIPGGARMDVTGAGRTVTAIRRMLLDHAPMLDEYSEWTASATSIPGGARLTVAAREPGDLATANRIRGLGFIGLLATGAHHHAHHLAIARGEEMHHP